MKTNIGKALVTSTLIASMAIGTTAYASYKSLDLVSASKNVYADNVAFTDLSGYSWAEDAINSMASQGILNGVGNGMFAPKSNVTRQEFAAMAIRAFGGEDKVNELANEMSLKAKFNDSSLFSLEDMESEYGDNWSNETIVASQYFTSISSLWGDELEEWKKPADRGEMAFILMTIAESLGTEQFKIKDGIEGVIGDYSSAVSNSQFKTSIIKAYSNGILVGMDTQGNYKPSNLSTRAEAACVMQRLVDASKRKEVVVTAPEDNTGLSPAPDGSNVGKYTGMVYPKEGDIINGVKVTRDPETGVLGLGNGQKGGIYLGIKSPLNGASIEIGDIAPGDGYDNMQGKYTEYKGYIFWDGEWDMIRGAGMKKVLANYPNPADGTVADIHGNITTGKKGDDNVFFAYDHGCWQWVAALTPDQVME